MNWTIIEGKWDQAKAELKGRWAKLTDQDVELLGAKKDRLVGKIVERYGVLKDEAEKQVEEWARKLETRMGAKHPDGATASKPAESSDPKQRSHH